MSNNNSREQNPLLKDVAGAAGVSPTTASMVFTDTGRISDDTRTKVLNAARDLGYVHKQRRRKRDRPGKHVALLILVDREWSFIWHFLTEMINQIEQDLSQRGYKTVLIPISHHENDEVIYQKINKQECRAVFSIHFGNERLFRRLESESIPVILIMNSNYQDRYYSICIDDFAGAYDGAKHLLSLGHKCIHFVDSFREDLPALSPDRYYGYRKAMEEAGIGYHENQRIICNLDTPESELESCFLVSLKRENPPTAFFCLDDEIAFRAWNALNRLGYKVPEDISILAPGDVLDYSKPYIPPITTMHIDMKYVGSLAVEMLSNRLKSDSDTIHVLRVKQQLLERASCQAL